MAVTQAEELREAILRKLAELGFSLDERGNAFPTSLDKEALRAAHVSSREIEIERHRKWLEKNLPHYLEFFASGNEIIPEQVDPVLLEVKTKEQHNLFRVARFLWSLPFSVGFGRRMRFLVMDRTNQKLIGILGLQSPPLDFKPRDQLFQYPEGRKVELVNQTMDVNVLGAVPPYSILLGGKLMALAVASNEVRHAYQQKYVGRVTHIDGRILPNHLVALTTTSAFGRSSLYNRVKYHNLLIAEPIGFTEGYGIFHLQEFFPQMLEFLKGMGIEADYESKNGPRPKWQLVNLALRKLGLTQNIMHHGVPREVYLFRLIDNLEDYMSGRSNEPKYRNLPFSDLAAWWKERWLLPRSLRVLEWKDWKRERVRELILGEV